MKSMTVEEFLTDLSARISASGKDLEQLAEELDVSPDELDRRRVGGPRQFLAPRPSANGSPCRDPPVDSMLGFVVNLEHADPGYYRSRVGRLGHDVVLPGDTGEESNQNCDRRTPRTSND
jgi:hypothetical protein